MTTEIEVGNVFSLDGKSFTGSPDNGMPKDLNLKVLEGQHVEFLEDEEGSRFSSQIIPPVCEITFPEGSTGVKVSDLHSSLLIARLPSGAILRMTPQDGSEQLLPEERFNIGKPVPWIVQEITNLFPLEVVQHEEEKSAVLEFPNKSQVRLELIRIAAKRDSDERYELLEEQTKRHAEACKGRFSFFNLFQQRRSCALLEEALLDGSATVPLEGRLIMALGGARIPGLRRFQLLTASGKEPPASKGWCLEFPTGTQAIAVSLPSDHDSDYACYAARLPNERTVLLALQRSETTALEALSGTLPISAAQLLDKAPGVRNLSTVSDISPEIAGWNALEA